MSGADGRPDRLSILLLHNTYQQHGGEDVVVEAEAALLASAGHTVHVERVANDDIRGLAAKTNAFVNAPYDRGRGSWAAALVQAHRADVVHVHNFWPLLTPAVHRGARSAGAAVVQTLHNYRLLCANGLFLRKGTVCEKCLVGSRAWGVVHRCYRGSALASLAVTRMQYRAAHQGLWHEDVDVFIALTDFARGKFAAAGLPDGRIVVKPNFTRDSDHDGCQATAREGAVFVGRLAQEKGIDVLIEAWRRSPDIALTIVGDGPDRQRLEAIAPPSVQFVGRRPHDEMSELLRRAACLIMPSIWFEGFPMTVVEAFAAGTPVIASRIGSLAEIVEDGVTGRLFEIGDADDLTRIVRETFDSGSLGAMGQAARLEYEARFTPAQNLRQLETLYRQAIVGRGVR